MSGTLVKFGAAFMVEPIFVKHVDERIFHEISPKDLNISEDLASSICEWNSQYQEILNTSYPPDSKFDTSTAKDEHVNKGEELAAKLQNELGQSYLVEYLRIP